VPTSVLLAVLAAAGLLALAPALVRRYDATERLVAERTLSTARVINRRRRRRTVPGRRPINPPSLFCLVPTPRLPGPRVPVPVSAVPVSALPISGPPSRRRRRAPVRLRTQTPAMYRRRRVLAALVLFNVIELTGLAVVGPGFGVSCVVSGLLLVAYLVHLRNRAVAERRRRRAAALREMWLARRQAELQAAQAARQAARREALRRAAAARATASRESLRLSQRYVDKSARSPVRGRAYESRAVGY
jgi:hypothetical protein